MANSITPKAYGIQVLQRIQKDAAKIKDPAVSNAVEKLLAAELRRQVKDFSDESTPR